MNAAIKEPLAEQRDNLINWRLNNWAREINSEWQDGPMERPRGPGWHGRVEKKYVEDDTLIEPIDTEDAHQVQKAMVRCMINDMDTARVLTLHYRDGWFQQRRHIRLLRKARNKFWKFLI